MKNAYWRVFLGAGLVLFGILALLQALDIIVVEGDRWGFIIAAMFILGGLIFLSVLASNRNNWWAAIPGFTLIGLGALIGSSLINEAFAPYAAGFLFIGISLSFWLVYFLNRERWWALIPAGTMLSLAGVIVVSAYEEAGGVRFFDAGGFFMLGLGITFALVAMLPAGAHNTRWAWIPAGVLAVIGVFTGLAGTHYGNYVWPAALIIVGGFLIVRALVKKGE